MKNQKGLTLVELLAAITILLLISSVIFGVLINSNKNYKSLTEKINLNQEANLLLATIRNYHQKQSLHSFDSNNNEIYKLKYDPTTKKAYIGTSSATIPLQKDNVDIIIKIDDVEISGEQTIYPDDPLYIYIKLYNQQGQSYEIETVIKQY
ncbi:prepilin-type N-terminal cleavage/methylation domain-containing protein [Neobacillus sp. LXY-1]|uniref:prepilin-type N-terminal cleavage/methylation domain-containing protein n=1 Tax=Neobacillus sp. LXY-1 TaxID=3379133 RepID=UPI003EE420A4